MGFLMTSEEFIIEFKKQHRDKAKFMFDLDVNVKQRDRLIKPLECIPEIILTGVHWVQVEPRNFQPKIDTNIFCIDWNIPEVEFKFYSKERRQKIFFIDDGIDNKPSVTTFPLKEFEKGFKNPIDLEYISKYTNKLTETYLRTILKSL